jgi:hypothetical protein
MAEKERTFRVAGLPAIVTKGLYNGFHILQVKHKPIDGIPELGNVAVEMHISDL